MRSVRVSRIFKVALVHILYYSGILGLWQRRVLNRKAVVLMYHRVLTHAEMQQTASHPALAVSNRTFERQMAFLKRRFHVLSVEEFANHLAHQVPFPGSSVVITFDDGWRDNYANALPILRRYDLPALIFLPTGFIGTRRLFWQETLVHLLLSAASASRGDRGLRYRLDELLAPHDLGEVLDLPASEIRLGAIQAVGGLKTTSGAARQQLIGALASELGVSTTGLSDVDGFVHWHEVHDMARDGINFGGHGIEHLLLTQASSEEADNEIVGSIEFLKRELGVSLAAFSYPNGYLTEAIVEKVRAAGYDLAFTTRRGPVDCSDDPMTVRRINVHEGVTSSAAMFLARMIGVF